MPCRGPLGICPDRFALPLEPAPARRHSSEWAWLCLAWYAAGTRATALHLKHNISRHKNIKQKHYKPPQKTHLTLIKSMLTETTHI